MPISLLHLFTSFSPSTLIEKKIKEVSSLIPSLVNSKKRHATRTLQRESVGFNWQRSTKTWGFLPRKMSDLVPLCFFISFQKSKRPQKIFYGYCIWINWSCHKSITTIIYRSSIIKWWKHVRFSFSIVGMFGFGTQGIVWILARYRFNKSVRFY